jgi:hypothetical protein
LLIKLRSVKIVETPHLATGGRKAQLNATRTWLHYAVAVLFILAALVLPAWVVAWSFWI